MSDDKVNIEVIRSNRKTIAMEITRDLRVIVRAPFRMPDRDIRRFIEDKSAWLEKHLELAKEKIKLLEQQEEAA
ncbi:MAG TPA: M48 family metallopeptidase, partial [Clostridiales bacterium]|nr:M48 family metallopeptidase [Clostridiales bacterium]